MSSTTHLRSLRSSSVRSAVVSAVALALACPAAGQQVLWDYVGNGLRAPGPEDFRVLDDLDGDGLQELLLKGPYSALVLPGGGGPPLKVHIYDDLHLGFQVAYPGGACNLGDLNGDGIGEYSLSASTFSGSLSEMWLGKVYVYNGRSHEVLDTVYNPGNPGIYLGGLIYNLGDINGDGFADYSIRSYGYANIFHGPDFTYVRSHLAAQSSSVGDVNGDGFADYVTSDGGYGPPSGGAHIAEGIVRIHSGIDGAVLSTTVGGYPFAAVGSTVAPAGDWTGDGAPDIVTGSLGAGGNQTEHVDIIDGTTGAIVQSFSGSDYVTREGYFGRAIASGHDINGDGVPDLVVGAKQDPWPQHFGQYLDTKVRGAVLVFSGATGALLWKTVGDHPGQRLGTVVHTIDDFNGDGLADWAALSEAYDTVPGNPREGRLTIYAGAPGDATPVCTAGPNSTGARARLWNSGPISVGQNRFELALSDAPPGELAFFMEGQLTPANPFGSGELCLGGPRSVLATRVVPSGGELPRVRLDLNQSPFTDGNHVVQAGDRWTFQVLYRDQGTPNASNALDVVFVP